MNSELQSSPEPLFRLGSQIIRLDGYQNHSLLSEFANTLEPHIARPITTTQGLHTDADIELIASKEGLKCLWNQGKKKPLELSIDIVQFIKQQRTFPAAKQGALNQALGRKSKSIIDATGGWGGDALLFWSQGYEVTVLERNPLMALLLSEAMQRLAATEWAVMVGEKRGATVPQVVNMDAGEYFSNIRIDHLESIDCVYFDPMFPAKSKASAGVNKRIQFLKYLVGTDVDAEQIAQAVLDRGAKRVVVKRPHHASYLVRKPDEQFASKLVHYDVYLANR